MAQRSDELKQEIEQTREQMGETADALAYKVDVPTRTKEWVGDKKDAIVSAVTGATSKVVEVTPDGQPVTYRVGRMKRLAEHNPLGLAIAGAGAGLIAGLLLPSTRVEDERMGAMADDVKSSAAEAGREALDRGKHVAEEVGSAALEAAKESGREEGQELTATLQEKAREVLPGDGHTTVTQPQPSSASTSR